MNVKTLFSVKSPLGLLTEKVLSKIYFLALKNTFSIFYYQNTLKKKIFFLIVVNDYIKIKSIW